MAHYRAIAAILAAVSGLVKERYPRAEFGSSLSVASLQPSTVEKGLTGEGIAICLWRVALNGQRRNRGPRLDALGNRFKPSLPLDLSILVIPYSADAERQARMLGWVMRTFEDAGTLTAAQLNFYLAESDVFSPEENVVLVCDPLALADHLALWDRLKQLPPAANYLVRMVLLDSLESFSEGPLVNTREFQIGVVQSS
ncbi:MAG: DUF4255 domain-containing protein [Synechococcaceae cyanobacterium]|jgi:hypothetical protein